MKNKMMMILMELALGLGATAYGQQAADPDVAGWQRASMKAQAVMAAQKEGELLVKRGLANVMPWGVYGKCTIEIFGNHITVKPSNGNRWSQQHMDAFAKEVGLWALMADADGGQPIYQYFEVTIEDSWRTAGE